MPQLVPFFFVNQVLCGFTVLLLITYIHSKYILPKYTQLFVIRTYLSSKL
uniref:ATP synthase protein 8 n=1 Tax=Pneumocystis oryctolagi TaxID=42067 RepID=A0A8A6W3Y7_9ASCO|nr:ATP synthase F0 subunit 8 [Pneumocystis oryctolagi]QTK22315.1 ATP synthase F0 subunit 8 [Pneumocystis oryctolagi]